MIQRIQTIYMLLAIILLTLGLFGNRIVAFDFNQNETNNARVEVSGFSTKFNISRDVSVISDDDLLTLREEFASYTQVENNVFTWKGDHFHWYFSPGIILLILLGLCLLNYKKPVIQLKLIRLVLFFALVLTVALFLCTRANSIFTGFTNKFELLNSLELSTSLGIGFYCLIAILPFVFLAMIGIKKDKNLLDSLNRLR